MSYIYIDESGDLGNKEVSSKYFVIAAIEVKDSKKLDRIITKIRRNSKKYINTTNEIKGATLPKNFKKKILKKVNSLDNNIFIIVFNKENRYKLKQNNNNMVYDELSSELAKIIKITSPTFIFVDKSKNKKEDIIIYNKKFNNNLMNFKKYPVDIKHVNSLHYKGLQIVDIIAWSAFQKYEHKNDEFIELLDNVSLKLVFEE
ncbi:DUF3800 domain-containing protein (plasmid) [Methanosphaera sp. ISO3-F5]|uniref:DUF3800 domain-containing protein n=1 Tax=Methanosphaera sp. ISO3-F5 TaxID=1452353 RepID=UPI002B25FC1E|nr:DUF3800 domain-containing protein [Methanosphaera sp. ISO3-F5]WQH65371.1 DUF3800 domain-containing protein [Methanosphaera sp. ISO3-F5]